MNNACICLTATIRPFTDFVKQADVHQRLSAYKAALHFYLNHTALPVFLLENSNFDLLADEDFYRWSTGGKLSIVQTPPHPDVSRGKGFQEFFMLDQFFAEAAKTYHRVFKITGRYIVGNFNTFAGLHNFELYMDFHKKMKVGLTGFFSCTPQFYNQFLAGLYRQSNDAAGVFIEHVVYPVRTLPEAAGQISLFPANPQITGTSGSYGASLRRNPYKMKLRNLERQILRLAGQTEFKFEY